MKTLNRITTVALGASLALTPLLTFAHGDEGDMNKDQGRHGGFLMGLFQGHGQGIDASTHGAVEVHIDDNDKNKGDNKKEDTGPHKDDKIELRADASIDARIDALERYQDRINESSRLSGEQKDKLSDLLQVQINALVALKAKIGDIDLSKDKLDTTRPEFRAYTLVLPEVAITAATDRLLSASASMDAFGAKLDARIDAADDNGVDVSSARDAYEDYQDKVADAKAQANAAADLIDDLKADDGTKVTFEANSKILKDAAAKLKAAWDDLKSARADATIILKVVKENK